MSKKRWLGLAALLLAVNVSFSYAAGPDTESPARYYVNVEGRFEIRGPKGWLMNVSSDSNPEKVTFTKQSDTTLPILGVVTDYAGELPTLLDYTNYSIEDTKRNLAGRQGIMKILESPHEIEVNGTKGMRAVYEISGLGPVTTKNIDYKFMKGKLVVSVMGVSYSADFDNDLKDFEAAIASFRFLGDKE